MIKSIARIVTRPSPDGEQPDMGICLFTKESGLKGNMIYEIQEFLGEFMLREIGPSPMSGKTPEDRMGMPCWGQDLSTVVNIGGKYIILSTAELRALLDKRESERDK